MGHGVDRKKIRAGDCVRKHRTLGLTAERLFHLKERAAITLKISSTRPSIHISGAPFRHREKLKNQ
jgi:hypothetical protein